MIKLYDYPDCPFSQKVRVALAEKELEFERVHVDLRSGEQRQPEFLKLNPYGRVPVLVDEDVVIYDSTVINEYLEDEYPSTPLMPEDSASRARVRMFEDFADNSFTPQAGLALGEITKPEADRDSEKLRRYQSEIGRVLVHVESLLDGKPFLTGDFSLADIAFVPRLLILPQLGVDVDPRLQAVVAWQARLRERPSVQTLGL